MARIIKKTYAENKVCISGRGRGGHVFGVGRCLRTLQSAWLVRKTGYMLTLPLTWLRYQRTGLSVGHPLNDPVGVCVFTEMIWQTFAQCNPTGLMVVQCVYSHHHTDALTNQILNSRELLDGYRQVWKGKLKLATCLYYMSVFTNIVNIVCCSC